MAHLDGAGTSPSNPRAGKVGVTGSVGRPSSRPIEVFSGHFQAFLSKFALCAIFIAPFGRPVRLIGMLHLTDPLIVMKRPEPHDLSRRERQIVDILYAQGRATAAEVQVALPDPPSYSAVRAMLRILEALGLVPTIIVRKRRSSFVLSGRGRCRRPPGSIGTGEQRLGCGERRVHRDR